jgi:hypothetical protein
MALDSAVLQWTEPLVRELRDRLRDAYPTHREVEELVSLVGGWPPAFRYWSDREGADAMWREVLQRAAHAGRTRDLLAVVLADLAKEGHHERLREIRDALDSAEQHVVQAQPPLALIRLVDTPTEAGVDARTPDGSDLVAVVSRRCHISLTAVVPAVTVDPEVCAHTIAEATRALRGLDVVVRQLLAAAESASDPVRFARLHQLAADLRNDRDTALRTLRRVGQSSGGLTTTDLFDLLSRHADKLAERLGVAASVLM